jgi:hypothetical protein
MFFFRIIRHSARSYSTILLILFAIASAFLTLYFYRKAAYQQALIQNIRLAINVQPQGVIFSSTTTIEKTIRTGIKIVFLE